MTWPTFYLICFAFGFIFSALSLLSGLGHLHLPVKWHLHFGGHAAPGTHFGPALSHGGVALGGAHATPGVHAPGGAVGVQGAHTGPASAGSQGPASHAPGISPINFFTLMAFLTWFGGTGYLLTQYSTVWFALGLLIATLSGVTGAAVVFLFLTKVVLAHEAALQPDDFDMIGVLGRLSVGIRVSGTGEMIYSQDGTRHTCGARAEDGTKIPKGADVVVTRYEKGIAYVRRWEDLARE